MGIGEELARLADLHGRGALTDEEFARAKGRLLDGAPNPVNSINALRLSRSDRWIGGVCGGIARSTGIESWLVRLLFCLLFLCGGIGILFYLLLWIFVPGE